MKSKSLPPGLRFETPRVVGEFMIHVTAHGTERCFLKTPKDVPVLHASVISESGQDRDVVSTRIGSGPYLAMQRLAESYGWTVVETVKNSVRWERPSPETRNFG